MNYRAVTFTENGEVELRTYQFHNEAPQPLEVILRNRYSIISPGTELACLAGMESWFPRPGVPGYGGVGEVVAVGERVDWLTVGDFAYTYGPHAEYYCVDTTHRRSGMCLKVDSGLDLENVPFTRMATIALTGVRVSDIELGDNVVVMGLGIVGNLAAQLARLQGGNVIGVDTDAKRCELAQSTGIEMTFNASQPGWASALKELCKARGLSTIIDATGQSAVIEKAASLVSEYGEIILLGSPRAAYQSNITPLLNHIHLPPHINFKGALEWRYPTYRDGFVKHSIIRNSEIVMELMRKNMLAFNPLLTHKLSPVKAAEAYKGLREKKDAYIGVIFDWSIDE